MSQKAKISLVAILIILIFMLTAILPMIRSDESENSTNVSEWILYSRTSSTETFKNTKTNEMQITLYSGEVFMDLKDKRYPNFVPINESFFPIINFSSNDSIYKIYNFKLGYYDKHEELNQISYDNQYTDYKAYFRNNSNTDSSVRFEKDDYFFIYDLSGGKMQWRAKPGQPAITDTLGSGKPSNSQDSYATVTQVNEVMYPGAFYNTNITYELKKDMLKENFILYGVPSYKDYLYLEYSGNIKFNKTLDICANDVCYVPSGTQDDFETSGRIDFKNSSGSTIFYLAAPIIHDSNGSEIQGIYSVHGSNAQMNFWLRINQSFLKDAVYPIFIDPTIYTLPKTDILGDTYVNNNTPTSNFGTRGTMELEDWFLTGIDRIYISANLSYLNQFSTIINITNASLSLFLTNLNLGANKNATIYHVINDSSFEETTTTWNNQPCGTDFNDSSNCNLTALSVTPIRYQGYHNFDVTAAIKQDWLDDMNISTFAMRSSEINQKTTSDFCSRGGSPACGTSHKEPYLTLTYVRYIDINSPTANQIFSQDTPTAIFNVTTGVDMDACYWSPNSGATNYTLTKNGNEFTLTNTTMVDGTYTNTVFYCNQSSDGAWKTSDPTSFEVDSQNVTVCRNLNVARNYTLLNNLNELEMTANTQCINIKNSSVIFDGNNKWINMTTTSSTVTLIGVENDNTNDLSGITVKNLNIFLNSSGSTLYESRAIAFWDTDDTTLTNITVYSYGKSGTLGTGTGILFKDSGLNVNEISNINLKCVGNSICFELDNQYYSFLQNINMSVTFSTIYDYGFYSNNNYYYEMYDSILTKNGGGIAARLVYVDDIILYGNGRGRYVNVTFNGGSETVADSMPLHRVWYFSAQVNYTNGSAVGGVNISAFNITGVTQNSNLTDSSGRIEIWELIEYIHNGTKTYYTNYTFNATLAGWDTNSQSINLTTNYLNQQFWMNDTTFPNMNITYPINNTSYSINVSILNYTFSELHPYSCWYSIDNGVTNLSLTIMGTNWTEVTSIEGWNNWTVYCNDSSNNVNFSSIAFFKDTIYPLFSDYADNNNTIYINELASFNVTVNDTNGTVVLHINGTDIAATNLTANIYNASYSLSTNGTFMYNWTAYGNGTLNNLNTSINNYYTVKDTPVIGLSWSYPITNINVSQDGFFNVTLNVSCSGADCGEVNISLDPQNQVDIIDEYSEKIGDKTVIYSQTTNVYEDGMWKNYQDARSLKDKKGFGLIYLENDSNFIVEIIDYNATSITLNYKSKIKDNKVPLVVWEKNETKEDSFIKDKKNKDKAFSQFIKETANKRVDLEESFKEGEKKQKTFNFGIDDTLEFGTNSTIVIWEWMNSTKTPYYGTDPEGSILLGQSFTIGSSWTNHNFILDYIRFFVQRAGNPDGLDFTMRIHQGKFGAVLSVNNSMALNGIPDTVSWQNFSFPPIQLNKSTEYSISWVCNSCTTENTMFWANRMVNVYDGGYLAVSSNNGSSWINYPTRDFYFEIWGHSTPDKGLINTTIGAKPFYTNVSNPYNISLNKGESQLVTFWVNATGYANDLWYFFAYANKTSEMNFGNITSTLNITIVDTTFPLINITFPSNLTNTTDIQLPLNYTVSDKNLQQCWYTRNAGVINTTIACNTNITGVTWYEGLNNVTIYVNDTADNINSSSITFRIDTTPPVLLIDKPIDGQSFTSGIISLNYTVSDSGVGLSSCWYKNNTDDTNITIACGTNTTISQGADGTFIIYMWANDSLNNIASHSHTWAISSVAPAVNLISPTTNTWFKSGTNFYLNFTADDSDGVDTCELWGNWTGTWAKNRTQYYAGDTAIDQNEGNFSLNLIDGYYIWNIKCNDTTGLPGTTDWAILNRTFGIDTIYPQISLVYPLNTTYITIPQNLNYTRNDTNLQSCWYSVNYGLTNSTPDTNCNNFSVTAVQGDQTWIIWTNDSANNQNSSNVTFFVDSISPSIKIKTSFLNGSYLNYNSSIILNLTVLDTNLNSCWYNNNFGNNVTFICGNNLSLNLSEALHTISIFANDTLNNLNNSEMISFTPDVTFPIITLQPVITITGSQTIYFNSSVNETNQNNCFYSIYNLTGGIDGLYNNLTLPCDNTNSTMATVSVFGTYNLFIYANDSAGNLNYTNQTFTVSLSGGGGGGGGGGLPSIPTIVEVVVPSNKTFCGDGICQSKSPNDLGAIENFYNCPQDCAGFNIDSVLFSCFGKNPSTPCIWDQLTARYVILFMGIVVALLSFTTVKEPKTKKQITLFRYTAKKLRRNKTVKVYRK